MQLSEMGISAITFDLDDTLWPCDPVIRRAEQVFYQWLVDHCPSITSELTMQDIRVRRLQLLKQSPELASDVTAIRLLASKALMEAYGYDLALAETACAAFRAARNEVTFFDDVMDALQDLSFHYRLGSLTNGNADLRSIGIEHLFDTVLYATLELPAKPAPDMFALACKELGVAPQSVLHVGDNPETDIRGARDAGCRTAWINRFDLLWPDDMAPADINITDLSQLVALGPPVRR